MYVHHYTTYWVFTMVGARSKRIATNETVMIVNVCVFIIIVMYTTKKKYGRMNRTCIQTY